MPVNGASSFSHKIFPPKFAATEDYLNWYFIGISFLRFGAWQKISNPKIQINEKQKFKSQSVIGEGPILI